MRRLQYVRSLAQFVGCAAVALLFLCWTVMPVNAATEMDDFSGGFVDYGSAAPGDFPLGIWDGSYNMVNLAGGLYVAGLAGDVLSVDDNNVTNVGWEGGRSSAPFLYTNVPAGQDFTATVKINAQTSGFWSAAGLIARASNSPTPPGTAADNADENFVTLYDFRTDAVNPTSGNTLNKRIENGAQLADINVDINAGTIPNPTPPPDTLPNPEPLPNWLRLERVGGVGYRSYVSTDGVSYTLQSHTIPTAGNALRDSTVGMQVGLAMMMFGGTFDDDMDPMTPEIRRPGAAEFDDFNIDTHDPLPSPGAPSLPSDITLTWRPGDPNLSQLFGDSTGQGILQWLRVADPLNPARPAQPPPNALSTFGPNGLVPKLTPDNSGSATFAWNPTNWNQGVYRWTISAVNDWGESDSLLLSVRIVPEPATFALAVLGAVAGLGLVRRRR